jgi:acyl-CoA synthetase (AMP-forming)/AMP-acid ligase II
MRIGAVAVPINVFLKPPELRMLLIHADIEILLVANDEGDEDYVRKVAEAIPELEHTDKGPLLLDGVPYLRRIWVSGQSNRQWATTEMTAARGPVKDALVDSIGDHVTPPDVAVIIYTSGTTAEPKGVILTHGALLRHSANVSALQCIVPTDRFYSISPFFWIGGLLVTLLSVVQGRATVLTQNRFAPEPCLTFLEGERATVVRLYPNARRAIEEHPRFADFDLSSVHAGLDWPDPDPERRMRVHGALGMTETCGPHIYSARWPGPFPEEFPGSHGPPVPGMEHKIIDENGTELPMGEEGEILVRGYALMQGIYKKEREEVFEEGGWYRTGDLGFLRDGVLYFRGRLKNVIKSAGANVSPQEVEGVLVARSDVKEAFVLGLPAGDRGEDVVAAIVAERHDVDVDAIRKALLDQLASFKVPRFIAVVRPGEVPRSNAGEKLDTRALKALVSAKWSEAKGLEGNEATG